MTRLDKLAFWICTAFLMQFLSGAIDVASRSALARPFLEAAALGVAMWFTSKLPGLLERIGELLFRGFKWLLRKANGFLEAIEKLDKKGEDPSQEVPPKQ